MIKKNNHVQHYTSRIEEIIHDYMIIATPIEKGRLIFLERGSLFTGKIFTVYAFKSTFVDKKIEPLPIWIVAMPFEIQKNQQRSFVRFDISLPVLIEYPFSAEQDEIVSLAMTTKDLSGGGLQVIYNTKLPVGKKVKLILQLPDSDCLEVDGEVLRILQPQDDRNLFWIGIKFLNIPELDRDKISKFIFKKQLEQRQKGL